MHPFIRHLYDQDILWQCALMLLHGLHCHSTTFSVCNRSGGTCSPQHAYKCSILACYVCPLGLVLCVGTVSTTGLLEQMMQPWLMVYREDMVEEEWDEDCSDSAPASALQSNVPGLQVMLQQVILSFCAVAVTMPASLPANLFAR